MKSLVLYFSRSGNTRFVAEEIAKAAKADIEEIFEQKDRKGAIGYISAGKDAMMKKPSKIQPITTNVSEYDKIYIGQPVWGWTMVPALRAMLEENDFTGKKIVLFCTMDGSGDKGCYRETRKFLLRSKIEKEMTFIKPIKDKEKTIKQIQDSI